MAKSFIRTLFLSSLLTVVAAPLVTARADDAAPPKNTLAIGYYFVFYHVHASDLSGPFTPPGAGLNLQNLSTPYFGYVRELPWHLSVELAAGVPPLTKSVGKGPVTLGSVPFNGQPLTTARWFAPSVLLRYKFFDETHLIRPYFGVGVNYVDFYDRNSTPQGNLAAGGPTRIELPASYGIAGTAGVSVSLPNHFGVQVSYSASRVQTHLSAITDGIVRTSSVSFNPTALTVAATFSF